ncbi:Ssu72 RNA polymerase II CTD phosphatase [Gonapodya prolifera JEL478]|uniref:RNA polymerase II subunit A C-terminal domain phosphatase SSU72 n=1 Tax=Gonapodya prolifera (strain JEL478) TaxID=1344416 RepID=A0A139A9N9_GONPJ|nr:Ssu72 RNA polymerase II CTD phosphatase [Gonapodya prolifera JEL478]|eukprot:KXS13467.1 Ssu72 RNA polymerase II CTD phosphatase [Gonapodya prolifera JEL478]
MPLRYAVICASNQNRSMEAHNVLIKAGRDVHSYGTGTAVRLPGPAVDKPNVYPFGTPYDDIYHDLEGKDPQLYTSNGLLHMLDRNRRIKRAPERFQESKDSYDVIVTCEERCFDAVCEDLTTRGGTLNRPVHVVNVEIRDNHEDAAVGARQIQRLTEMLDASPDVDADIDSIVNDFARRSGANVMHAVHYY